MSKFCYPSLGNQPDANQKDLTRIIKNVVRKAAFHNDAVAAPPVNS